MTEHQFLALLCGYVIVVVLNITVGKLVSLPEHVISAKANREEILSRKPKFYLGVFTIANVVSLCCGVVGFVGMFAFWPAAPWFFALGIAGKILFFRTIFWKVKSGLEDMFSEIELLLDGVILTLVFFGPAKQLFET